MKEWDKNEKHWNKSYNMRWKRLIIVLCIGIFAASFSLGTIFERGIH